MNFYFIFQTHDYSETPIIIWLFLVFNQMFGIMLGLAMV